LKKVPEKHYFIKQLKKVIKKLKKIVAINKIIC